MQDVFLWQGPFKTQTETLSLFALQVLNFSGLCFNIQNSFQWKSSCFLNMFPQSLEKHDLFFNKNSHTILPLKLQVSQDRKGSVQRLQSRPHQSHTDHLRIISIGVGRQRRGGGHRRRGCRHWRGDERCGQPTNCGMLVFSRQVGRRMFVEWIYVCIYIHHMYVWIYILYIVHTYSIYIWSSRLRIKLTTCGLPEMKHGCWHTIIVVIHSEAGGQQVQGHHIWVVALTPKNV